LTASGSKNLTIWKGNNIILLFNICDITDIIFPIKTFGNATRKTIRIDWEEVNSRWESWFGRKTTMSGKIPAEQIHTRLNDAFNELQDLRNYSSIPQELLDVWENKFKRWLADINEEV